MKIFLDGCIDWRLSRDINGHEVRTARQMGWTSIKNGELLALVAKAFDVFVTVDRNLAFQQHVAAIPVAVVVLRATSNRLMDLRAFLPELMRALNSAQPGRVMTIGGP